MKKENLELATNLVRWIADTEQYIASLEEANAYYSNPFVKLSGGEFTKEIGVAPVQAVPFEVFKKTALKSLRAKLTKMNKELIKL